MSIYHLSIKIISRGKGKSAVAASADRSGAKRKNEYDGIVHDFTRKGGIAHTEILLPQNAPQEFSYRRTLWNSVEKIEKSKNSQLAREIEVALPQELDREKQIELVREYVKENFVNVGMCADIALHDKNDGNPHCHILLTMRPLNEDTTWGAKSKKEYIFDENGEKVKIKNGNYKTRKIKHQNMILREIKLRIKVLLNWIRGIGKEEKAETENIKSTFPPKENLLSIFENLIHKNADKNNADLEKYIESYQLLKEKDIASLSELKESITDLRDKNYKITRALKDTEKMIDENTAELILFESAKRHLKEHLGESKTLAISEWKSELATLKKNKKSLYNQILEIREEVEQAEKVKNCIEQLQEQEKEFTKSKSQDLGL